MIVVINKNAGPEDIRLLEQRLSQMGLSSRSYPGQDQTVFALIGDTSKADPARIASLPMVESVRRISEPYRAVSRKTHPQDSVVCIGNAKLGGGHFAMIAGPCSVESEEQIMAVAKAVKAAGADLLRGGAFKPRTSPYMFQGLKEEGLKLLLEAKKETGLPIVTELMDISTLELYQDVDVIQVGARNMQNFNLLQELGRCKKPILLKRGLSSTLQELLMSAEYIMNAGNENIILCERGIRTFETATRNTLDLSAVPALQELSHLPVIVDPSHATGKMRHVAPMGLAAAAAGADGIMVEVHNDPACALCDSAQALTPAQFADLSDKVRKIRSILF